MKALHQSSPEANEEQMMQIQSLQQDNKFQIHTLIRRSVTQGM